MKINARVGHGFEMTMSNSFKVDKQKDLVTLRHRADLSEIIKKSFSINDDFFMRALKPLLNNGPFAQGIKGDGKGQIFRDIPCVFVVSRKPETFGERLV